MRSLIALAALALAACQLPPASTASAIPPPPEGLTPSPPEVIAASKPAEWRALDPENTLYMDFPEGRVVIEMAPQFSPNHVANVKALSREGFFVNGAVTRVQDNFVTQWTQAAEPPRPPKVGVEKLNSMCVQFSAAENAQMMGIKNAFDTKGLLNPGKVIPTLQRCAEYGKMLVRGGQIKHPDLPRF